MPTRQKSKLWIPVVLLTVVFFVSAGIVGWYWYDGHVDRSGWVQQHEQYYYRDFHNKNVTGWQEIDGSCYYFDEAGVMQTGWLPVDENLYYLDTDGKRLEGWLNHHGHRYYLDQEGRMLTGLQEIDGELYLMDADGHMVTGRQSIDGKAYYFTEQGPAQTGVTVLDGETYCFGEDGVLQTGWISQEDGNHYYLPEGPMALGLQEIDGKTYFFDETGLPVTGWFTREEEYSYYFGQDGAALTGPQEIDGRKHYFTPKGIHVILVNRSNPIPDYYDPDLVTLFGWNQVSQICLKPMQQMLADCEASGRNYTFNSSYRSGKNQEQIIKLRTEEYMDKGMSYENAYAKTMETVAAPGTSEHEMGLAADIVGKECNEWLAEHCWEYGFILRYPPEKGEITGITFEPWHFRYVGKEVSMDMKDSGLCLEEYLGAGPA